MVIFNRKNRNLDEKGFASITIALVLIAVLALLTVGFAQLARREQQNALDKQLSNQAYYAAESGVNDANNAVKSGALTTSTPKEGTDQCMDLPLPGAPSAQISSQSGVSYSCIMVDLQPESLTKDMASDGDWTTYFTSVGSAPDSITLTWNSMIASKQPRADNSGFAPTSLWNARAAMQFSITPLSSYNRDDLINNTYTVYGYPSTSSDSASYGGEQGKIVSAACDPAPKGACHVTINGLPAGVTKYAIHIHDYYDASHVALSAKSGATSLKLADSQAVIDVTGKARDVLKRILVHVPIHPSHDLPDESVQAQDICKYFTTDPLDNTESQSTSLSGYPGGALDTCSVGD